MANLTWKKYVYNLAYDLCKANGSRTFTLPEIYAFAAPTVQIQWPNNHHWEDKIRQTLQFLSRDKLVTSADGRGTYTLRTEEVLPGEVENPVEVKAMLIAVGDDHLKREYLVEVFARNRGWVAQAKAKYGTDCFCPNCHNTFLKPDGTAYCEVHHIRPLYELGDDALYNLSILCAHHHRMAHFATPDVQQELRQFLLHRVEQLYAA